MSLKGDVDAEVRFHLEARAEELMTQGLSREAARAQAVAEFGDVDAIRAGLREIDRRTAKRRHRGESIAALIHDLRYAVRALARSPVVSLTIVLTLTLGVGVNATMFSLLDVMYFRPPAAVANSESLRRLWADRPSGNINHTFGSGFDYKSYVGIGRALAPDARAAAYMGPDLRRLGRGEGTPRVAIAAATASLFDVLGVRPQRGRFYTEDEAGPGGSQSSAVISDALWRARFDRDENIIGRDLQLGPRKFTIIGVAPASFRGPDVEVTDVWLPPAAFLLAAGRSPENWWGDSRINGFQILLRVGRGASDSVLTLRATQQLRSPGGDYRDDPMVVAALGPINVARGPRKAGSDIQVANRLAGVSIVVLLIACANVVNLLLARASTRRREIAVRLALGISRGRLIRLLLVETVLLSFVAAVGAVIASAWGSVALRRLLMPDAEWAAPALHWRVFAFALTTSLFAAFAAAVGPALQSSTPDVTDALRSGSRAGSERTRLRSALVVAQTALSLVLLVGAVLFVRSLHNAMTYDVGYTVDRVIFASAHYDTPDSARDAAYARRLESMRERLGAIPGVERVAFTSSRPNWSTSYTSFYPDADTLRRKKPPFARYSAVSRDFFAAAGIRLIAGTTFPDERGAGPLSAVINQAMADALWPQENPVGRCVRLERADAPCATIVGVASNALEAGAFDKQPPHMYLSLARPAADVWDAEALLRVDPRRLASIEASVRAALGEQFPGAIRSVTTMAELIEPEYRPWKLGATLFTAFGVLALIVAAVGVFSTVSYSVSRRTHEFGVRMALGARSVDVLNHVLGAELRVIAIGLAAGIVIAVASGKLISSLLYDIEPSDPLSIGLVAALLTAAAITAAVAPAWRASRVDPVSALRAE